MTRLARLRWVAWLIALPSRRRRRFLISSSALMFAGVFGLLIGTDPVELGALLFAPAVILVALALGPVGGVVAGLAATGLYAVSRLIRMVDVGAVLLLPRGISLVAVGLATGLLAQRALEAAESTRLAERELAEREASLSALVESALDAIVIVDDERRCVEANPAIAEVLGVPRQLLVGKRIDEFIQEQDEARLHSEWDALLDQGKLRGEYAFVLASGERRSLEFSATAEFRPGLHLLVMRDVSERVEAEGRLQRRVAQQAAIADVGLQALAGPSLSGLLEMAAGQISRTLGVEFVSIWELDPGGEELQLRQGVGWRSEMMANSRERAPASTQIALTLRSDEPVVVEHTNTDERFEQSPLLAEHEVTSGASVIIGGPERHWGVLAVHTGARRLFSPDDVYFLQVVANTLAIAIERDDALRQLHRQGQQVARLASDRQQIVAQALNAEDRARQRISQLLHDGVLQDLLTVRQDLAQVDGRTNGDQLRHAREGLQRTIGDLRAAVFDLHPVALEHAGLRSAIKTVADYQAGRAGFTLELDLADELQNDRDELVFSLARELLTNISRHAEATTVRIRVEQTAAEVLLEVGDDGRGMRRGRLEEALREGHIGLASAAQRVEALGGSFTVKSKPGEGTVVSVAIPLDD